MKKQIKVYSKGVPAAECLPRDFPISIFSRLHELAKISSHQAQIVEDAGREIYKKK